MKSGDQMKPTIKVIAILLALTVMAMPLSGCKSKPESPLLQIPTSTVENTTADDTSPDGDANQAPTLTLGDSTVLKSLEITTEGGGFVYEKSGDPLNGFELAVPPGAYTSQRAFEISQSPISGHTFGDFVKPISPLITVDNGGDFSQQVMTVRIPVKVSPDHFAMGFFYDKETGNLEGMPLVARDSDSITVATQHFSSFFISEILMSNLNKDIDTSFHPGVDDFQFANNGSYVASGGHCAGQCIAALWYYFNKPDGKSVTLYGRYDNNGNAKTPGLWEDDALAYRLCSAVHQDAWNAPDAIEKKMIQLNGRLWKNVGGTWQYATIPGLGDEVAFYLFAYGMLVTKQPQMVGVWSNAGGGHCIITYRVNNGKLYIADPNYPGDLNRVIDFAGGQFSPYNSGADLQAILAGKGKAYEKIMYYGNWSLVDKALIANRWDELKAGSVATDQFPAYTIKYKDPAGTFKELTDGTVITQKKADFSLATTAASAVLSVYRDGIILPFDSQFLNTLKPGNNRLGFLIEGKVNNKDKYIDFKYLNVICSSLAITPDPLKGEVGKDYTFHADLDDPPKDIIYEWSINNDVKQSTNSPDFKTTFTKKGDYKISVWAGISGTEYGKDDVKANITDPKPTQVKISPAPLIGDVGNQYTFEAMLNHPWPNAIYDWSVDDAVRYSGTESTFDYQFSSKGPYVVSVVVNLAYIKTNLRAVSQVTIEEPITTTTVASHLAALQQQTSLETTLYTSATVAEYDLYTNPQNSTKTSNIGIDTFPIPITWQNTTFSGSQKLPIKDGVEVIKSLSGTVSPDGNTILSLIYTSKITSYTDWTNPAPANQWQVTTDKMVLKDIPIRYPNNDILDLTEIKGKTVQQYIVEIASEVTDFDPKKQVMYHKITYVSPLWNEDSSLVVRFRKD